MNTSRYIWKATIFLTITLGLLISQRLPAQVVIDSIVTNNVSCDALKGQIIVYASGAVDINYSINNGVTFQASNTFKNVDVDDYLIIARDILTGTTDLRTAQILELADPPGPSIICPEDLYVECGETQLDAIVQMWQSTCVSLNYLGESISNQLVTKVTNNDLSECGSALRVEFETHDVCGSRSSCMASINVVDNEAPVAICPQMLEIFLEDTTWPDQIEEWIEQLETSDNCRSDLLIEHNYSQTGILLTCLPEFMIDVEFSATDICDNSSLCTSSIKIYNELAPEVFCDQNTYVKCAQDPEETLEQLLERFEDINSFDEDIRFIRYSSIDGIEDLKCGETFVVHFSIEDNCMRTADCSSVISVSDLIAPEVINCPQNLEVAYSETLLSDLAIWKESILAEDNCGTVSYTTSIDNLDLSDYCDIDKLDVAFMAIDACGNIEDACRAELSLLPEPITLSCPPALSLQCGDSDNDLLINNWLEGASQITMAATGYVLNSDYTTDKLIDDCSVSIPVVYTLNDACNNLHSCLAEITLIDDTAPIIDCPLMLVIDADEVDIELSYRSWLETVSVSDNCGQITVTSTEFALDELDCTVPIEFVFTATDDCQNTASCQSSITINSEILYCPELIEFSCEDGLSEEDIQHVIENIITENNLSSSDFEINLINLDCDSEQEQQVVFFREGFCYEGQNCKSLVRINPIEDSGKEGEDVEMEEEILKANNLYFPNIFSSGRREEINKSFTIFGVEDSFEIETIQIYNRWGSVIWKSETMEVNDTTTGWNGRASDGRFVESGSYLYVARIIDQDGLSELYRGVVTFIR